MDERRTYTINEAAGLTGLHKNTIRQRIRLGQLHATIQQGKFGEEYRIGHEALVEAGLLPDTGPLEDPGADPVLHAEFTASPGAMPENGAAMPDVTVGALSELYQRHEQAMFRLGYMQGNWTA
jgi:excisionase family DNA binding protein